MIHEILPLSTSLSSNLKAEFYLQHCQTLIIELLAEIVSDVVNCFRREHVHRCLNGF